MSDWMPIETAPRDGTEILATILVRSKSRANQWWETHVIAIDVDTGEIGQDYENGWEFDSYSHWMPLPAPPANAQSPEIVPDTDR